MKQVQIFPKCFKEVYWRGCRFETGVLQDAAGNEYIKINGKYHRLYLNK